MKYSDVENLILKSLKEVGRPMSKDELYRYIVDYSGGKYESNRKFQDMFDETVTDVMMFCGGICDKEGEVIIDDNSNLLEYVFNRKRKT